MATAELPGLLPPQEFFGDIYRDPFLQSTIRPNVPFPSHPCPIELQWQPSTDMAQVEDVNSTTVAPQETTLLHRPSRSSCPNPGESSYPDGVWEAIRPMFRELHTVQKCTLPVTMMILDLVCNFRASEDAFKKRKKKHWPECRKNKTKSGDENQEAPHHQNGSNSAAQQTRPCKVMVNYAACPPYVVAPPYGSIPHTPSPQLYRVQTLLLLSIDKYVKGLFDSIDSSKTDDAQAQIQAARGELTSDKWRLLWSRCQAISTLVRKKKVFTGEKKKKPLDRLRDNEEMYRITKDMLDDTVFKPPEGTREACSPHILSVLWSICRILQGLPPQMGYGPSNDALFLAPLIQALGTLLCDVKEGHNIEMRSLLEYLYNDVSPTELRDTTRISCLCAARALSSRLGPNHPTVLEAWADYHENWDPSGLDKGLFLESYRQAWAECETKYGMTDDRTIIVLHNYASAAYYTCHENGRAKSLAAILWERTWVADKRHGTPSAWTVKLQTMAEAAKVLALTGCLNHENKRMSRQKLKEMRKELNLRSKSARKRWRQTIKSPPSSNDAEQAIRNLGLAADHLYSSNDRDCKLVAAGLFDLLASLIQEFSGGKVDSYRSNAESIRIAVINDEKSIEVSE
ncbi:hypothetical protein FDECE_15738 [Fusarium decemcellulare]|nr:hypothetical protein FDECE_15738 [Fusarium decemcellulare]